MLLKFLQHLQPLQLLQLFSAFYLRNTVYWNPNILTDKNGKAAFEYYNADTKGTYRIVVEGIDDDGKIGRQVYRYEVK